MRTSRPLALQKLALAVVRNRDREAALVLGDHLLETYGTGRPGRYGGIETGRVRRAVFHVTARNVPVTSRILTGAEHRFLIRHQPSTFTVPAREVLYNLTHYAGHGTEAAWRKVFSMWTTSRQDTYRAMVLQKVLPSTIRFGEIDWVSQATADLAYHLFLERTPPRLKRPIRRSLLDIQREDLPATREVHFDEPLQGTLLP